MNRPLVSVVMPVYNAEKYLQAALDSILHQTYSNLDIIIINDGSTDRSKEIILNIKDARLRYFENPVNWGIVKTRNRALDEAKGDYIAVLDSDDIALPERIAVQVDFLEKNPDYGMCGSYFKTINGNDKILKKARFPANDRDARSYLMLRNCFCHSTVMMRSGIAKEIKYNKEFEIVEDFMLWNQISQKSKIINLPVFTTYYRVHGNNISTTKRAHMFKLVNIINSQVLDDLKIKYSTEELEIHSNSLISNSNFFREKGKLEKLENWIFRYLSEIKKNDLYNEVISFRVFAKRWIVLCNNSGNRNKMFFNRLILKYPGIYMNLLYNKVRTSL